MAKYCGSCGTELEDNALFCGKCGKKINCAIEEMESASFIKEKMEMNKKPESDSAIKETMEESKRIDDTNSENKKKSNKEKIIILFLIVIIIGLFVYIILSVGKNSVPINDSESQQNVEEKITDSSQENEEKELANEEILGENSSSACDDISSNSESNVSNKADMEENVSHTHNYNSWKDTGKSYHSRNCSCGVEETEAHSFDLGKITKEPTEISEGIKTYTCTVCGAVKNETIEKQQHVHSFGGWIDDGNTSTHSKSCSCGEKETAIHIFDSGKITKEPTETNNGVKTYTCTECGATKTKNIDKLQHTHSYGVWTDDGNGSTCSKSCACGDKITQMHNWTWWEYDDTTQYRTCIGCGVKEMKEHIHDIVYNEAETYYKWRCKICGKSWAFEP